ncbi:hypothetical protein FRB98_008827 [Tulasnella sp. 332]|nr:hypothetical protein FRB98_008827 [Tulasnella sp. 332]
MACTLGNVMADAMLEYRLQFGSSKLDGALMNSRGICTSIHPGKVTRGDLLIAFPFINCVVDLKLTGQEP